MPPIEAEVVGGQQAALNLGGQVQIVFKSAPLVRVEVVEAKTLQRVCDESIGLHRIVANLT